MGKTLSGKEREQRAAERLSEARGQLAAIQARMAQSQSALDALSKLEQSAAARVTQAERALDVAEQSVVDAHAAAMIASGTDDEAELVAEHGAAVDARKARRQDLDQARCVLQQTRQKVAAESATIQAQIAEDEDARQDLQRIIQSLERNQKAAHYDAHVERLLAAKERRDAIQARIVEHEQAAADIRSDLDAHGAELQAILAAHPELKDSAEYKVTFDSHRALREILSAYAGYIDTLLYWYQHPLRAGQEFNSLMLAQMLTNGTTADYHTLSYLLANSPNVSTGSLTTTRREVSQWLDRYAWQPAATAAK